MLEQIERVLEKKIRPELSRHGGVIESLGFENGVYRFRMLGQCAGCPSAFLTTESLIQETLAQECPEVKQVVLVQQASDSLLEQARSLLKRHGN